MGLGLILMSELDLYAITKDPTCRNKDLAQPNKYLKIKLLVISRELTGGRGKQRDVGGTGESEHNPDEKI